jgi:hypothetical protein
MIFSNRDLQSRPGARRRLIRTRATNYIAESLQQLLNVGAVPFLGCKVKGRSR